MANTPWVNTTTGPLGLRYRTIDTSEVIKLGCPSETFLSSWVVEIVPSGLTGGFTPKGTSAGSGLTGGNLKTLLVYRENSEDAVDTASPISAAGVYYIPADGLDVYLDCTVSAGSFTVYVRPGIF